MVGKGIGSNMSLAVTALAAPLSESAVQSGSVFKFGSDVQLKFGSLQNFGNKISVALQFPLNLDIRSVIVPSGGKVHGPRRMFQKYFKSNFDSLSSGIDPN